MFCNKCGTKIKREYLFCPICGAATRIKLTDKLDIEQEELAEAVRQLKGGNEDGFSVIYFRTYKYVYNRAKYMLQDEQETQDLVQDVYIALYNGIYDLKDEKAIYGWLKTVIFRQGLRFIEKNKKIDLVAENKEFMFDALPDEGVCIEKAYGKGEDIKTVKKCIDKLSEEQRLVVLAYYYDEMSIKEIAKILEISEGTVKSRLYLARKHLMTMLEEEEEKQGYKFFAAGLPLVMPALDETLKVNAKIAKRRILAEYKGACQHLEINEAPVLLKGTAIGERIAVRVAELGFKRILLAVLGFVVVGGGCGVLLISGSGFADTQKNMPESTSVVKEVDLAEVNSNLASENAETVVAEPDEIMEVVPDGGEPENDEPASKPEPENHESASEPEVATRELGAAAPSGESAQESVATENPNAEPNEMIDEESLQNTSSEDAVNDTAQNKNVIDLTAVGNLNYQKAEDSEDVQLSWSPVSGADGYEVYVATSELPTYQKDSEVAGTECTVLADGTYYRIKVRPYIKQDGKMTYGPFSNEITTEPDIVFPQSIKLTGVRQEGLWPAVTVQPFTVNYYSVIELYRATSENGEYQRVGDINCGPGQEVTVSEIYDNYPNEYGQIYYYKIRIKAFKTWPGKSDKFSNYSNVVSHKFRLD